jgi:DNA-binding MarR family transcriptional regulator
MLKIIFEAISNDIDFYHDKYQAFIKLPKAQQEVLLLFREHPEKKLAPKNIITETGIPERTVVHALGKLIDKGFLQKRGTRPSVWYQLKF